MVGDIRAHKVCEQLLNYVKVSNLNYLVNETPYSAFITIRKRFTKGSEDITNVTLVQDDSNIVDDLKRKNNLLAIKCKDFASEHESLSKDNSDLKTKLENYKEENIKVNQKLFILKGEIVNQELALKKVKEEAVEKSKCNQSIKDKLLEVQENLKATKKLAQEKDDTIDMLNIIVENKKSELCSLKNEIIELQPEAGGETFEDTFKCDQCDYVSKSKKGLKIHLTRMHEIKCDQCGEMFGGETKLKTHMCRIPITNPISHNLYMKNWFIANECIRVFCNEKKKQVSILHSKQCDDDNCPDVAPKFIKTKVSIEDLDGIVHLHAKQFMNNNVVDWDMLFVSIFHNDHFW